MTCSQASSSQDEDLLNFSSLFYLQICKCACVLVHHNKMDVRQFSGNLNQWFPTVPWLQHTWLRKSFFFSRYQS